MGQLKRYEVTVGGKPAVLKLTADQAKRYPGAKAVDGPPSPGATNPVKARAQLSVANKARSAANKARKDAAEK